jgi:hypothetical protein
MPPVYRRLFAEHPETEAMFRIEGSDPVKGAVLSLTIEAILDFSGERSGYFRMIECEAISHDAYGTPRDLFVAFFAVIPDTLRTARSRLVGGDRGRLAEIAGRARRRRPMRERRGTTAHRRLENATGPTNGSAQHLPVAVASRV